MVFIGGINLNNNAKGGEEAKNQQFVAYFKKHNIDVVIIDTHNWKKRIIGLMFNIIRHTFFSKSSSIYLSLSFKSALKLMRFFNIFGISKKKEVHYFVIGGKFHNWLAEHQQYVPAFKMAKGIYPESVSMVKTLKSIGLPNAKRVPNVKTIPTVTINRQYEIVKFVFLSRISPTKGSDLILDAVNKLNTLGLQDKFEVTFYGNFHDEVDNGYETTFKTKIEAITNVNYKGFLKLNIPENYELLANNNIMLFPTYWHGEGYPGVLIDAFIAELPIIASDWNHNKEIVLHENNGLLVTPKNANALMEAMQKVILDVNYLKELEKGAKDSVSKFDIEKVLPLILNHN